MDDIADDLLTEILLRIPIKSVFMCKCVSKRWLSLISDPFFPSSYTSLRGHNLTGHNWTLLTNHHNNITSHHNNLTWHEWSLIRSHRKFKSKNTKKYTGSNVTIKNHPDFLSPGFSLEFLPVEIPYPCGCCILASSNGLLLCRGFIVEAGRAVYYVCNPLTKQCASLPASLPSIPNMYVQVGFISDDKGFKVVMISPDYTGNSDSLNYSVLSASYTCSELDEWKWRHVNSSISPPHNVWFLEGNRPFVTYKGILHWQDKQNHRIIAYDTNTDTDHVVKLPTEKARHNQGLLGTCQGRLRYLEAAHDGIRSLCTWSVWSLLDYDGGIWEVEFRCSTAIQLPRDHVIWEKHLCLDELEDPLAWCRNTNTWPFLVLHPTKLDLVYIGLSNGWVIAYNIRTQRIEEKWHSKSHLSQVLFILPQWPTLIPPPPWGYVNN
ncbi:F-box protein [Quillaja saponaria]|uniref:F-box protein n=1 Tax=Quillaja saponaria TaxID=32244 RepID=A0AAD7QGS6_QUISA|nr:F-box protein [Quillaja saponaria]